MTRLFVVHRPSDAAALAARLLDDLGDLYGDGEVQLVGHRREAQDALQARLADAAAPPPLVLLLLTHDALDGLDGERPFIEQPSDPVRQALAAALAAQAPLRVLLHEGHTMPPPATLPQALRPLCDAPALPLRAEAWTADLTRLAQQLTALGLAPEQATPLRPVMPATPLRAMAAPAAAAPAARAAPLPDTAQVFISYARVDRAHAQALASALEAEGISCWWDRELTGGGDFAAEIERYLVAARLALVLWSDASVRSDFVRDESQRARDARKLMPVRIADVQLPLGFGTLHTLDLVDWNLDPQAEACRELITQVRTRLADKTAGGPAPPRGRPAPVGSGTVNGPRRQWLTAAGLAGAALAGGGGWLGWRSWRQREAQRLLQSGLDAQFARAQFDIARNDYRSAIALDPSLGIAHYHLATVYLRLYSAGGSKDDLLLQDAATHFQAALQNVQGLDRSQARDAQAQVAELGRSDEAAPVTRVAQAPAPAPLPAPAPVPSPLPAPTASPGPSAQPASKVEAPPAQPTAVTPGRGTGSAPAPAPAAAGMPRPLPAPADTRRSAEALAEALFSADQGERDAAANSLTLRPGVAADALPRALTLALQVAPRAASQPAARDGLLATVALLQSASPATLRANARLIEHFVGVAEDSGAQARNAADGLRQALQRASQRRPVVYLQIAHEGQRALAEAVSRRMQAAGYAAPGIERVAEGRAPDRTELRIQGGSDPGLARWCQELTAADTGAPVVVKTLRNARPGTDTYEIWFGRSLCTGAAATSTACRG